MRTYAPRDASASARPASDRQVAYAEALLLQVTGPDNFAEARLVMSERGDLATTTAASRTIDALRTQVAAMRVARPAAPAAAAEPLALGMYRRDGAVYRVVNSQAGRPYAKRLNPATGKFDYAAGAIRTLTPADRMSLSEAAEYGRAIGRCCVCGATLTDPESVARGIGPVCGGRV